MKSEFAKTAGLFASLALGTLCLMGSAGAAQAAPSGGGICVPDHVYHLPTTYQVPECACPSGSLRHTKANGDYSCSYPQRQFPGTNRAFPKREIPKVQTNRSVGPR